jgi:hypothetical protein
MKEFSSAELDSNVLEGSSLYEYIIRTKGISGYLFHNDFPGSVLSWMSYSPSYKILTDQFYDRAGNELEVNEDFGEITFEFC